MYLARFYKKPFIFQYAIYIAQILSILTQKNGKINLIKTLTNFKTEIFEQLNFKTQSLKPTHLKINKPLTKQFIKLSEAPLKTFNLK